ncbi:MAG: endonuclease/exonuclease/phosphatase family protein [Candidatus Kapaibacterium sp.]
MKFRKYIYTLIFALIIAGCSEISEDQRRPVDTAAPDSDIVIIGTFNIQWLGDGVRDRKDRTSEDYKLIAETITESGADILALQEIENDEALFRILKYLPDYSFYCGDGGRALNTAVIFRKNMQVDFLGEYTQLQYDRYQRPGLIVRCKYGNFDWLMMVVHFKSTSRYDDTPEKLMRSRTIRAYQAEIASRWADSVLAAGNEEDVLILGDFNDTPRRKKNPTLQGMLSNDNLNFITTDLKSCKFPAMYVIDHIVVSDTAMIRLLEGSAHVHDFNRVYPKEEAKDISDHCPVLAVFDISLPDND